MFLFYLFLLFAFNLISQISLGHRPLKMFSFPHRYGVDLYKHLMNSAWILGRDLISMQTTNLTFGWIQKFYFGWRSDEIFDSLHFPSWGNLGARSLFLEPLQCEFSLNVSPCNGFGMFHLPPLPIHICHVKVCFFKNENMT